ncbi:MAG: beta-glucosidase family protein [Promethearchaeota archaeon]
MTRDFDEEVRKLMKKMTLKEKLKCMSGDGTLLKDGLKMIIRYNKKPIPAGVIKRLNIPGILFSDGPRGVVMNKCTCFPVSMARGASWDRDLERRIGEAIGVEARALGANFFGGVCINLLRHPAWGRAQETYGEDPYLLGEMGAALVEGVQKHIMACAKHFACNSIENARFKVDVKIKERTLREIYLPHFKKCVDAGVASIMSAYNKVNGYYCGHNKHLLRDILKEDWKFEGFVITDFVFGIRDGKKAVNAGVDIEMPFNWKMKPKKLMKYLSKGEITEEQINEAVERILKMELKFKDIGDPNLYKRDKIGCKEHMELALEAARKSIVLLKNEEKMLPLNKDKIKKIAVIGKLANIPNIGDKGSSRVYPPLVITPLEGLKNLLGEKIEIIYNEGKNLKENEDIIKEADAVIIVVGYTHRDEGEYVGNKGGDRDSLKLRPNDEILIKEISKINSNCIVVLEGGSAIIMEEWKDDVKAILMAWYPGMEGGTAIAEIIFGKVNPSAKLPIIFPKSQEQLPFFDKKVKIIEYGYFHGYRLLDKNSEEPAFPFGFGLSYTDFSYSNLKLDKEIYNESDLIIASVDIENKGNYDGEEIVQLYVGYKNSAVERPIKELKAFQKIFIKKGEKKTVNLEFKAKDLAYFDENENKWIVEKIEYIIGVGPSSRDSDLIKANFKIN